MKLTTILVGADVSVPSDQAIDRAAALALKHGAKLVIVHAQANDGANDRATDGVSSDVVQQLGEVTAAMKLEVARRLDERLRAMRALGVDAEVLAPIGAPGEVVAQIARERAA
ncbi:hypothetical protein BH11MYX1_BH11MYX1_03380 [soil metagenome]